MKFLKKNLTLQFIISENISDQPTETIKWMIQNSDRIYNGEENKEQQELKFNNIQNYLGNFAI